jgi:hypothetical protein
MTVAEVAPGLFLERPRFSFGPGDRFLLPSGSIVNIFGCRYDYFECRYSTHTGYRGEMNLSWLFLSRYGVRA